MRKREPTGIMYMIELIPLRNGKVKAIIVEYPNSERIIKIVDSVEIGMVTLESNGKRIIIDTGVTEYETKNNKLYIK